MVYCLLNAHAIGHTLLSSIIEHREDRIHCQTQNENVRMVNSLLYSTVNSDIYTTDLILRLLYSSNSTSAGNMECCVVL